MEVFGRTETNSTRSETEKGILKDNKQSAVVRSGGRWGVKFKFNLTDLMREYLLQWICGRSQTPLSVFFFFFKKNWQIIPRYFVTPSVMKILLGLKQRKRKFIPDESEPELLNRSDWNGKKNGSFVVIEKLKRESSSAESASC